jgi:hypothetical protein
MFLSQPIYILRGSKLVLTIEADLSVFEFMQK